MLQYSAAQCFQKYAIRYGVHIIKNYILYIRVSCSPYVYCIVCCIHRICLNLFTYIKIDRQTGNISWIQINISTSTCFWTRVNASPSPFHANILVNNMCGIYLGELNCTILHWLVCGMVFCVRCALWRSNFRWLAEKKKLVFKLLLLLLQLFLLFFGLLSNELWYWWLAVCQCLTPYCKEAIWPD